MVDEVEEKSAIDNDDVLSRFGKALQFGIDQPLERIADTFKSFGFNDTEKFLRDLTEQPENYVSAAEKFMENNGMGYSWEYLPRAVVEQIGSLAGNIATRAAGAAIGGTVAGPGGAIAGALTAPALFEAIQILGPTVYERARNEGREEPVLEDWLAAAPTTAISGFLGSYGAQNIAKLNNLTRQNAFQNIARGALDEGATETLQSAVEQTGTTAFTKSGFRLDQREAFGEGIIGAGTGGGINAVFEAGGKGVEKLQDFKPSDSLYTTDEPQQPDADFTGVTLINGQPKFDELKRKTNTFRGSGIDVDVSRTGPESPVDYLNRLLQQELQIPGTGRLAVEDLKLKTKEQLAFELGLISNVQPFVNPLSNLTDEQNQKLDEKYEEYLSNNKINKLLEEVMQLSYLPLKQRDIISQEINKAVDDVSNTSSLTLRTQLSNIPVGTQPGAMNEVFSTADIGILSNMDYVPNEEFDFPSTAPDRTGDLRILLDKNENLDAVQKELIVANQTWNKGGTYRGLEQGLNLTYYQDQSGQTYQRTPAEQIVIIKHINDSFQRTKRIGYPFSSEGSTEAASGHINDLLSTLNVDKDEDLQRELFYNSHYSLPKGAKPGEVYRTEEYTYNLIDYLDLTSAVDRNFVIGLAGQLIESEQFSAVGDDRREQKFKEKMHESRIKHLEEQDSQAAYAQHYINALNPFLTRGGREHIFNNSKFAKEVALQFLAIQDQDDMIFLDNVNESDLPEPYQQERIDNLRDMMPSKFQTSFLDYLGAEFDARTGSIADNTETYLDIVKKRTEEAIKLFDEKVTDPDLRKEAQKRVALNAVRAQYIRRTLDAEKEFHNAYINSYIPPDEAKEIIETELRSRLDNTVQNLKELSPGEDLSNVENRINAVLADENTIQAIQDDAYKATLQYINEHISEFRDREIADETVKERMVTQLVGKTMESPEYQQKFSFLTGILKNLALDAKFDPSNIMVGRDISKPDFWTFLQTARPELFALLELNNIPQYGDIQAEVAIKEAENSPFATAVDPVFMSSFYINENIQKLIPGRPYAANDLLKFLMTPHKQQRNIIPTDITEERETVFDREGNPVVDSQGNPVTKPKRVSEEDRPRTAKDLFPHESKTEVNEDFRNQARKELINTSIAPFLYLRHAKNKPVTREELETLLSNASNTTLMTVTSSKQERSGRLDNTLWTGSSYTADQELHKHANEFMGFQFFHDYKKPKEVIQKQLEAQDTRELRDINNDYRDKGGSEDQYAAGTHPPGRFWIRLFKVSGNDTPYRDFSAPPAFANMKGERVANGERDNIAVIVESQNDAEGFRGSQAGKPTEATFKIEVSKLKSEAAKLLPEGAVKKVNELLDNFIADALGDYSNIADSDEMGLMNSMRTASVTNELSSIINMEKQRKTYGFDAGGTEGKNVAERTAEFLDNFLGFREDEYVTDSTSILNRLNDKRIPEGRNEDNLTFQSYDKYKQEIEDDDARYRLWQQADLASNLREDIVLTKSFYEPVTGHKYFPKFLEKGYEDGSNRYIGHISENLKGLLKLYGGAKTISADNLIPLTALAGVKETTSGDFRALNPNEKTAAAWMTNLLDYSGSTPSNSRSEYFNPLGPFILHAMFMHHAQNPSNSFIKRIGGSMAGMKPDILLDFLNTIAREKDLPPYKFLESVTPKFTSDLAVNEIVPEAKRIWKNWQKAVKEFENYTPAVPLLAALDDMPYFKSVANGDFDALAKLDDKLANLDLDSISLDVDTPFQGVATNAIEDNTPLREGLGQDYSKLSIRALLNWFIENEYPDTTHMFIPHRFVNQTSGNSQARGAHENFDLMAEEYSKIMKSVGAEPEFVIYHSDGEFLKLNTLLEKAEKEQLDLSDEEKTKLSEDAYSLLVFNNESRLDDKVRQELKNRIKNNPILRTIITDNRIGGGYLLPLKDFVIENPNTKSGFSLKKVFRGHRLGGLVGKGIVGLRDEIYNSPLSKYVT